MKKSARLYSCARCHQQVIICSHCDRGNIYCGAACSQQSRTQKHQIANQIYQKTHRGRQKHAERQRRYRQRQNDKIKKVTDQGSIDLPPDDLLPRKPNEDKSRTAEPLRCRFCHKAVSDFLRIGYLDRYRNDPLPRYSSWLTGP
jgi:hypothetical protein